MKVRGVAVVLIGVVGSVCPAQGATDTVLILHTNDFHDHIRPGYDRVGGMAYVAGYIGAARRGRDDVLVLDAGT